MDFSLGEDRQILVDSMRRLLADRFDFSVRETAVATAAGFDREVWNALARLGVIGSWFGEDAGGFGGSPFDVGATFGELGRALATGPFLATLMAGKLLETAGEGAALTRMIAGEAIATFAHDPAIARDGTALPDVTARDCGGHWNLTGAKGLVDYAPGADLLVVTAAAPQGLSAFLVEAGAPGLAIRGYALVDGGSAAELGLADTPARLLGEAGRTQAALDCARATGLVATCWEAVAIMDAMRDATLEYLRTRKQFGVAIGKFQALQHRMARLMIEIEQARSAAINAAAAFGGDAHTRDRSCSAAKYTAGVAGSLVAQEAIQMHGGIGMTWELPLSHYAKRLTMLGHVLGDEDEHLARFIALGRDS